jgi:YHS domain-containing protein
MFKQLIFILSAVLVLCAFTLAQDKPETEKKEKQECSKDSKCCSMKGKETSSLTSESSAVAFNKVCPVKGGEVDPDSPTFEYQGKVYGFCCPGCESKFEKDPETYLKNLNEDGSEFLKKS